MIAGVTIPPGGLAVCTIELPEGYWDGVGFYIQRLIDDANWTFGRRRRAAQHHSREALAGLFGSWRDSWH